MRSEGCSTSEWIRELTGKGELWKFYKSKQWIRIKEQVLQDNHYECRICKGQGRITIYERDPKDGKRKKISTVHHVKEVRKHPELALERYYYDQDGTRHENLIPVCKACHNKLHNRTFDGSVRKGHKFTTPERW